MRTLELPEMFPPAINWRPNRARDHVEIGQATEVGAAGPEVYTAASDLRLTLPLPSTDGVPVVKVTRGVFMKPQPSQVTPFGLARMKSALATEDFDFAKQQ